VADRPPAHGRYWDKLKASPPKFTWVVNLIPARKPLDCLFELVVVPSTTVSSLVSTESIQLSLLTPTQSSSSSRALSQSQDTAPHPIGKKILLFEPRFFLN
jgi:hypothetical protein